MIPSLKSKMYHTSNPTAKDSNEPTTVDTKSHTGEGPGFLTDKDVRKGYATGGLDENSRIAHGMQSATVISPLLTCQTGATGLYHNEQGYYHIAERDLQALSDYRRAISDLLQNQDGPPSYQFCTYSA